MLHVEAWISASPGEEAQEARNFPGPVLPVLLYHPVPGPILIHVSM